MTLASCGGDSPTQPPLPVPAHIAVLSGNDQSGVVGVELGQPIAVRVTTDAGVGMRGAVVSFHATSGGGAFSSVSVTTDSTGVASVRWTLGTSTSVAQRGEASVIGAGGAALTETLTATAKAGAPAALSVVDGDRQGGEAGSPLGSPLRVKVSDAYGNAVGSAAVSFAVAAGGGAVSPVQATTDSTGIAASTWTLGPRLDSTQVMEARAGTLPSVAFAATARLPRTATLSLVSGDAQRAVVGTPAAESLRVVVKLADGRPAVGAPVTWTPDAGSASPDTTTTDASGIARTRWTAGIHSGTMTLSASAAGVPEIPTVRFSLTADPGAPASVERIAGDGQTAVVATTLPQPLVARILDQYGNAVPGATLAWTPAAGTVSPASGTADGSGRVSAVWTTGTRAGPQSVVAASSVTGAAMATFAATATPDVPDTVALAPDSIRFGALGRTVALDARVVDRYGNAIAAPQLSWRSVDGDIATVAAGGAAGQGVVQPRTNGETRVVATAIDGTPSATDTVLVRVRQVIVSVEVTPANDSVEAADSIQLAAAPLDSTGIRVGDAIVTWTSQNTAKATVSSVGMAQALDTGRVAVVASAGGLNATAALRVLPEPLRATSMTLGSYHGCLTGTDGRSYCWGDAFVGQLGRSVTVTNCAESGRVCDPRPGIVTGGLTFTSLAGTDGTTCGLTADGQAYCWGSNRWGQLGNGSADSSYVAHETPAPVSTSVRFTQLSMGSRHVCGLTATGSVYCWGQNHLGEIGVGDTLPHLTPEPVGVSGTVAQIGAGSEFTCALVTGGAAYCWGWNQYGAVGDGTSSQGNQYLATPTRVAGGYTYTQLAVGSTHTCALGSDARVYCWGQSDYGQTGVDNWSWLPSPQPISHQLTGASRFTQLTAGQYHTCGISADGGTYCWGRNADAELGNRSYDRSTTPLLVEGGRNFVEIASHLNSRSTCGRTTRNAVYCWGWNQYGQLGDILGSTPRSTMPTVIARPK